MDYISVKDASIKFGISERRVQKLCETNRIPGAERISGVWIIPSEAQKPSDTRSTAQMIPAGTLLLRDVCAELGISIATGKNWVKLGKLIPAGRIGQTIYFDSDSIVNLKSEIATGQNNALKSRRNKKFVSGFRFYNSYVSPDCEGVQTVSKTIDLLSSYEIEIDSILIGTIVADAAIQMLSQVFCGSKIHFASTLAEGKRNAFFGSLVEGLILDVKSAQNLLQNFPDLFAVEYSFEPREDVLGLLYISCLNMGNRKTAGLYYTPTNIVQKMISNLHIENNFKDFKILDPCCGTGNFLLQVPDAVKLQNIYGNDIDPMSVMITRINMALNYKTSDLDILYKNFTVSDYLLDFKMDSFDYIIGNPPWGYEFSDEQALLLNNKYKTARGRKTESYDVFTEKAVNCLNQNGVLSFVLPEAILNVKSHQPIREVLLETTSFKHLNYLGNVFDGVQCPCVILQLEHTQNRMSCVGMEISTEKEDFTIYTERHIDSTCFSFNLSDLEYEVLNKIQHLDHAKYLKGNAVFALGIVTGNNKKYISSTKTDENEMILKGSDLLKYRYLESGNYIHFNPNKFQQVAPPEYYRAEEKLLYRFICNQLVFAFDENQTLSLNSCNLLIPKMKSLSCKYVMAVLNSRVAQFYFTKSFNSVKVLRSHIEQIPIPDAGKGDIDMIEQWVEQIRTEKGDKEILALYEKLDKYIAFCLYEMDEKEYQIIQNSMHNVNQLLVP